MQNIDDLLASLTLEEKADLCAGQDFWHTRAIPRLGIPSILMTDGPHGLRNLEEREDLLEPNSVPATCFPPAATTANSFDPGLAREIGRAVAEEALEQGISVVLGPGVNIKRSPLCGRNFEYFSEDPLLAGEMAAGMIEGLQSRGVGACIKHFAANNQETARFINNSVVDERALREIYLEPFELAVKKAAPWTVMCSYNRLNGTYNSENPWLLTDILRCEWGFGGLVMSDWMAVDERTAGVSAGLDLEMPYSGPQNAEMIAAAVRAGTLGQADLDQAVRNVLSLVEKSSAAARLAADLPAHDALARRALGESAVLLKNDGILPIKPGVSLAIIGEFAEKPRYQGSGSSKVNAWQVTSALQAFEASTVAFEYARGYDTLNQLDQYTLAEEALAAARGKDVVLVFAGLPDADEYEGFDRSSLELPAAQNELISRLAAVNPNVVVVLHTGGVVELPWMDDARAVLLLQLGGQAIGGAALDLLTGAVNPSGKLAETWPLHLEDNPTYINFGDKCQTEYRESVYVGYRYYDKASQPVRFPFGYGLSYTQFELSELQLDAAEIQAGEPVRVSLAIQNVGSRAGREVVQVYVSAPETTLFKPIKELKAFRKILLEPGEKQNLSFTLDSRTFSSWDPASKVWHVEDGAYQVLVGSSSRELPLSTPVYVHQPRPVAQADYHASAPLYYHLPGGTVDIPREQFQAIYDRPIPESCPQPGRYTINTTPNEIKDTRVGKTLNKFIMRELDARSEHTDPAAQQNMREMLADMPLRSLVPNGLPYETLLGMVDLLNKKYLRGFCRVIRGQRAMKKHR